MDLHRHQQVQQLHDRRSKNRTRREKSFGSMLKSTLQTHTSMSTPLFRGCALYIAFARKQIIINNHSLLKNIICESECLSPVIIIIITIK